MRARWLVLCFACGPKQAAVDGDLGRLDGAVLESSGLIASARHPGLLWTHGDSGTGNVLFGVRPSGELLTRVQIGGAPLRDWEDITADGEGHLWLSDLGNNVNDRQDLALVRIPEPGPSGEQTVEPDRVLRVRYPDQTSFPPVDTLNYDAEAVFFADGRLYVLTKHRSDQKTTLYRSPGLEGDVILELLSSFDLGGPADRTGGKATSAALHPDGRLLAVLAYHAVFLFERPESGDDWLSRPVHQIPLVQSITRQCEAIAWLGDALVITNEEGRMFRIDAPRLRATPFPDVRP
jgi:hypothetical protein